MKYDQIVVEHVNTGDNVADAYKNVLGATKLAGFVGELGMYKVAVCLG